MKELSIFVDESGDFGAYEPHAPFYLFTLVFHDQNNSIKEQLAHLEGGLAAVGFNARHCFHAGPIIRREEDYHALSITERRKCLNRILTFWFYEGYAEELSEADVQEAICSYQIIYS